MSLKRLLDNYWFSRVILIIWVVSAVFVLFVFTRIDSIIHVELYKFGLQFSYDWASQYWVFARLVCVCLGLPMALSVFVLAYSFTAKLDRTRSNDVKQGAKQEVKPQPAVDGDRKAKENIVISCPSCKKVFGKPLVMLDFSGAKPRLVNVCPYCNHILGCADEDEASSDVQVIDLNKKLTK